MIKAVDIHFDGTTDTGGRKVTCNLRADTKAEVAAIGTDGSTVVGLMANDKLQFGCFAICADKNFGMLGSNGIWKF